MEQHTLDTLKALFDLGGVVVVTAMLYLVWKRLNEVTDRLFDIVQELRLFDRTAENSLDHNKP